MSAIHPIDKYGFRIIKTAEELLQAKIDSLPNVKIVCPGCGKELLRTIGDAEFILQYECKQHTKTYR